MFNETAYDYAVGAGCSPDGARVAAAIAQAESSGNPYAHNPVPPDDSYGLWQINMLGRLGPERRAQFGISSNAALYDPAVNARAMYAISGGCNNWRPWSTFTSGAYRRYLQAATGDVFPASETGDSGDGDTSPLPGFVESLTQAVPFFSGAPAWLPLVAIGVAAYLVLR